MAEALHAAGYNVRVVTYPLGQLKRELPFPVHRSPGLPRYHRTEAGADTRRLLMLLPTLAGTIARVAYRDRIDVIHAHHYEGLLASWPTKVLQGVPVIYDAHTTLAGELPYYHPRLPRRATAAVGRMLDARGPKLADHTVATSQYIASELVAYGVSPARDLTHGRDAWLVDDPSANALAEGMATILEHPDRAHVLGAAARRRVVNELPWSRIVARLELIYRHRRPRALLCWSAVPGVSGPCRQQFRGQSAGRYGFVLEGVVDAYYPAAGLAQRLLAMREQPQSFGRRQSVLPFVRRQLGMQWRKRSVGR